MRTEPKGGKGREMTEIKHTQDGRAVTVEAVVAGGQAHLEVYLAAKRLGRAGRNQLQSRGAPAGMYGVLYCHGRKMTGIALTREEYEIVDAVLSAAEHTAAQTPEGIRERLVNERADLVARWQGARDEMQAEFERLFARGDTDEAFAARARGEVAISAARNAVSDWDDAHPEFTARRQAEAKAAADRHMWD